MYKCLKVGVLGNHDKASFFEDTTIINLHRELKTINGITFAGFQGCPKYNDKPFGQHLEIEAEAFVSTIYNKQIDFFLSHSNPKYEHLNENDDTHRGFAALTDLIDYQKVRHMFHGHLHDPFSMDFGKTSIHSVYPYLEIDIHI